ncbi:MAG: PilZ domain-containing protein [Thermoanaerobaculia bacterium]
MQPDRRRSLRVGVDGDGPSGVVRGLDPVAVRDLSPGGLRLSLGHALETGAVYPLTLFLRGLVVAAPIRVTRCRQDSRAVWEAGGEFLWRDPSDAGTVRRWIDGQSAPAS